MQQAASVQPELSPQLRQQLSQKDRQMVRLYLAGCFHKWDDLPGGVGRTQSVAGPRTIGGSA